MKTIEKKIYPEYFYAVIRGIKNFEIRKDEDDLNPGDRIILKEWNGTKFTGNEARRTVKYVLRDADQFGLKKGYCIIGW